MAAAECPSCGSAIEVGRKPHMGQKVRCFDCDTRLEIVWLEPLELDWPAEEYEGFDDEDELDDDEDW
jgi:lysine biosynthesis protein LysW